MENLEISERVSEAIDICLDAINNGTLAKGSCRACMVANLIAHGKGGVIFRSIDGESFDCNVDNYSWSNLFSTMSGYQSYSKSYKNNYSVLNNIRATKFSVKELMKMEFVFETNTKILYTNYSKHTAEAIRKDQIKGLEAVVKVMLEFDNCKAQAEEVFTKKAELIPIF